MTAGQANLVAKRVRLLMDLRRDGISDARVLSAIDRTPRDHFVPAQLHDQAYDNVALPIGQEQTISQPFVVALMTEKLEVEDRHKILEIGTGSGYQTAILARLGRRVYSIERLRSLIAEAEARFATLRLHNIACRYGDGAKGWPEQGPFDRIIVTAAAPTVPHALVEQLLPDGIMVVPIGPPRGDQSLMRVRRTEPGFSTENLGTVRFVPLIENTREEGRYSSARA
jgi:protein-L-isoaspartate(D-aspartate) O-methyltransferase